LNGTFKVPEGFRVLRLNPLIPADASPDGAVDSRVISPAGVTYNLEFSPIVTPCVVTQCTSPTNRLKPGDANPAYTVVTISPDVGAPSLCGFSSDQPSQVGCDAVIGSEYVAVQSQLDAPGTSTADAISILRAAVAYVRSLQ